jgi:hypothetical protein
MTPDRYLVAWSFVLETRDPDDGDREVQTAGIVQADLWIEPA